MRTFTSVAISATLLCCLFSAARVAGQNIKNNFPDRRAIIADVCPAISLSDFSFENKYGDREQFFQSLSWKNTSEKPVAAFEVVVLKYDPFNRRMVGTRWTIDGKNSVDWSPLAPGEVSKDGTIEYGSDDVFTEIAYVRNLRFADGTLWTVNDAQLTARLRTLNTGITELGDVKPDSKPKNAKE
jgi:hypothetical protein